MNNDGQIEILLSSQEGIVCLNSSGGFIWQYFGGDCDALVVANILDTEELEIIVYQESVQSVNYLDWQGYWN